MREKRWPLVAAAFASLCLAVVSSQSKAIPDAPGAVRPVRVSSPRLAPLPEDRWAEAHKAVVAKYGANGRAGNALATLRAWFGQAGLVCDRIHPVDTERGLLVVAVARRISPASAVA